MRILHVIPVYAPAWQYGGPVRSVSSLCEGLVEEGHVVTVATTNAGLGALPPEVDLRREDRNGVHVIYFRDESGLRGIESPSLSAGLEALVASSDIVHVSAVWQPTGISACQMSVRQTIPYVISPRGSFGRYSLRRGITKKLIYYFAWERQNFARASGFHFTSQLEAKETRPFTKARPFLVSPNTIETSDWHFDAEAAQTFRRSNGCDDATPLLLYAGRLHHKKGLEILPIAFRYLDDLPWKLVLVGHPEDQTHRRLAAAFASFGLGARVTFLPSLSPVELRAAYGAANLFLLPSRHENFGNSIVEALACGAKVVTTPYVGAAEFVPQDWLRIAERTVPEWSASLRDEITAVVAAHGARRPPWSGLADAFSRRRVARDMAEFYSRVLSHSPAKPMEASA